MEAVDASTLIVCQMQSILTDNVRSTFLAVFGNKFDMVPHKYGAAREA